VIGIAVLLVIAAPFLVLGVAGAAVNIYLVLWKLPVEALRTAGELFQWCRARLIKRHSC
jgi:hypothetical protein